MEAAAVLGVVAHPGVRADLWDCEKPVAPMHATIYHLLAKEERFTDGAVEDAVVGLVSFAPMNGATWNPHIVVLPEHRGRGAELMALGLRWMFENTPARKLVAFPPVFKPAMVRVFEKCGFAREGFSPKSFPWRGEMHDRVLMGIEKESVNV